MSRGVDDRPFTGAPFRPITGASTQSQSITSVNLDFSRPTSSATNNPAAASASAFSAQPTGRRTRVLRTQQLQTEVSLMRKQEAARRDAFALHLQEAQLRLQQELSRLPDATAAEAMRGKEDLLEQPDFSKGGPGKWGQPASFAEIFQTHPGYRPTPRDKKSPEWNRLFNPNMTH
jgi:hypothetical protein